MQNANHSLYHKTVVYGIVGIMLVPIIATLVYSLSSRWGATILPDGFTVDWYLKLLSDMRFIEAFGRSLLVCVAALALSTLLILPAIFVVFYYFPKLDRVMNLLILLPFAVPPVVSSVGLLQLYADSAVPIVGTPWILIGTYFTIALPFMYRALANSFSAINLRDLMDAAHLLGASTTQAFLQIVLPNVRKGLMASLFLSFSFLLGEFVFANILVGTRYETLQIYLYNMRQTSGHFTSALVMTYFLFIFFCTWLASRLGAKQ
ncbi:ABC transporter permease [Vibrio fluvialis]|uniref:Spermidine Putrescine ABC transporter permease component potC n=1 Tax=Vibrio fluvialis PG41 TaxID=1336752 RepID=S7JFT4_VIBFL|nr:ABC transporter permease [Vibrio fluvialis]EKO3561129.1 ABC transporter permease [Vibrio fluvialis]EPP22901.1 Spermidine Putrescine ABC transporter permease component potC [Vibrio fluvialis PG41]MBL4305505.1 ABC transporter permease [Vibrio fluvialis]MBY7803502.1 ABC transporter permease [Vibrio fluvialis]MBY7841820.1 ABC transporter permease [Vibrio fluvialis]